MQNLRPADYFQNALEIIYSSYKEDGYKLLKSNVIKKKNKDFVYRLSFYSSHYNYVDNNLHKGSVMLEVYCIIEYKGERIYSFQFSEPRSASRRFELLTADLTLNEEVLNYITDNINKYFISIVNKIEGEKDDIFENLELYPVIQPDDYSWTIQYNEKFVELFGANDILNKYRDNKELFDSIAERTKRNSDSYFYYITSKGYLNDKMLEVDIDEVLTCFYDKLKMNDLLIPEYIEERYKLIQQLDKEDVKRRFVDTYAFVSSVMDILRKDELTSQEDEGILSNLHSILFKDNQKTTLA